jgi:hypothetical protein
MKTGSDAVLSKVARENQVVAYEICHMVDGRLLSHIVKLEKTHGALLLRTLSVVVTRGSAERTAVLHSRVAAQAPYRTKEHFLHGLHSWRKDPED